LTRIGYPGGSRRVPVSNNANATRTTGGIGCCARARPRLPIGLVRGRNGALRRLCGLLLGCKDARGWPTVVSRTTKLPPRRGRAGPWVGASLGGRSPRRFQPGLRGCSGGHSSGGSAGRRRRSGEVDLGWRAGRPFRFLAWPRGVARISGFVGRRFSIRRRPGSDRTRVLPPVRRCYRSA